MRNKMSSRALREGVGELDAKSSQSTRNEEAAAKEGKRIVPDDEPVFLSSRGRANWDHRWSWRKALERAGLHRRKGLTLYSLRHSFATHYLERAASGG